MSGLTRAASHRHCHCRGCSSSSSSGESGRLAMITTCGHTGAGSASSLHCASEQSEVPVDLKLGPSSTEPPFVCGSSFGCSAPSAVATACPLLRCPGTNSRVGSDAAGASSSASLPRCTGTVTPAGPAEGWAGAALRRQDERRRTAPTKPHVTRRMPARTRPISLHCRPLYSSSSNSSSSSSLSSRGPSAAANKSCGGLLRTDTAPSTARTSPSPSGGFAALILSAESFALVASTLIAGTPTAKATSRLQRDPCRRGPSFTSVIRMSSASVSETCAMKCLNSACFEASNSPFRRDSLTAEPMKVRPSSATLSC
mmetsp:Transcript_26421/g.52993  ORF Transcript_26421/g.52993 Transcript_26421/m.52993 type:complete len:313 (+) Transcript_26421:216-1154(+)